MSEFLPYGRQTITPEDISAVVDVLSSSLITQGPTVPAFESALCTSLDVSYSVAVNSATSALHLACLALGLQSGDILWTSPVTFVASANCARYCGASVDFIDIDPSTGLISLSLLEQKLNRAAISNKLPKIIVPVHLAGTSCHMREIKRMVSQYDIKIIEDASHAIGASYLGNPVGCCAFSDITVFSFHPVKIITTGEGGLATTNDSLLAYRMQSLRSHGITKDTSKFEHAPAGPWSYEQQQLGFNYRMNDIQAALGLSQLARLREIVQERNNLFLSYLDLLSDTVFDLLSVPPECYSALHLAVIRIPRRFQHRHRNLFETLRNSGIGVQLHYSPVHLQPYYRRLGFNTGDFPNAEEYANTSISIPLYPGLSRSDQIRVVDILKAFDF